MTDETPEGPSKHAANFATIGMTCAVISAVALLIAAELVFVELPRVMDIYKSIHLNTSAAAQFVFNYGIALWGAVLICTILSFHQAFRHGGKPKAMVVNIVVLLAALGFMFVIRRMAWIPMMSLFQGL